MWPSWGIDNLTDLHRLNDNFIDLVKFLAPRIRNVRIFRACKKTSSSKLRHAAFITLPFFPFCKNEIKLPNSTKNRSVKSLFEQ